MKRIVTTLLLTVALAALSAPAFAHPPGGGHHGHGAGHLGPAWVPAHAPRHGKHHRRYARHGHQHGYRHGHRHGPPRHYRHRHGPRCGHPYRGTYYRPRHPTYGAYGASLTLRLDDVWLSVHGRR
jgi:hypothetical protein